MVAEWIRDDGPLITSKTYGPIFVRARSQFPQR
jgi:hypothetical protein